MKKLLCALAFMACGTLSAAAADVGTIRNDYPGDTEAQAQMLKTAAWRVLPRLYDCVPTRQDDKSEERLSCVIAGVTVMRNEHSDVKPLNYDQGFANSIYGLAPNAQGKNMLHTIDTETLATKEIARLDGIVDLFVLGKSGLTDYIKGSYRHRHTHSGRKSA